VRILLVNKFLYPKGGDAISTLATGELLAQKGHDVVFWGMKHSQNPRYPYSEYFVDNIDYGGAVSAKRKVSEAFKILYSLEARKKINKLVQSINPDIVHLNNFAHQISPSILDIFNKYNIPLVMTLHDYKLVCPTYSMLLDGKPCDKCKNGRYYNCFFNKCTKGSYSKSLVNTLEMYLHHKILHIYDQIDVIIATSQFLKEKHIEMGLLNPIICLPNFVTVEDFLPQYHSKAKIIVYFGRLSKEKGLFTLLDAVKGLNAQLKIIGEGELKQDLKQKAKKEGLKNIIFMGYKTGEDLKREISYCAGTVIPSECYEAFGRTIIESFALGKPVIGSRIGGIPELVKDGETGYTFTPGDASDLRNKIELLLRNSNSVIDMGKNARRFVEEEFDAENHYNGLMKIYHMAINKHV